MCWGVWSHAALKRRDTAPMKLPSVPSQPTLTTRSHRPGPVCFQVSIPLRNVLPQLNDPQCTKVDASGLQLTSTEGSDGARILADLARVCRSPHSVLTAVDLRANRLGDAGAASIAAMLQSDCGPLANVHLGYNHIGAAGAAALAACLRSNRTLTKVHLSVLNVPMTALHLVSTISSVLCCG